ncbi:AraC family transcriptional regulator [Kaistia sp. 32K]|nr:AraC family transcriptional regulator [Kaistia sp. 32K]
MTVQKTAAETRAKPTHFSTASLPVRDQFDAWRAFMAPAIDLDIRGGRTEAFKAEQTAWDIGSFALTRASLPGDGRERVWQHHRKNALDHWCFVVVQGDAPGAGGASRQLFFRSLGEPFDGSASDSNVLSLYIPRELFGERLTRIDSATSEVPNHGIGALLADYFISLEQRLPDIAVADLPQVAEATRAMIAACVRPSAERIEVAQGAIVATLMERARQIVRANLGNMRFGPEHLARDLGVSRSRLYRIFEPFGGVARYIHRQRMLAAHTALSDPANASSIVRIAETVGFGDASGFSRGFRQEFGYSPRDARVAGTVRLSVPPPPRLRGSQMADFATILRRLAA